MSGIIEYDIAEKFLVIKPGLSDDTRVHQLNRFWCVIFFIIVTLYVGSTQYAGNRIQCWCPAQFTTFQKEYIESYCWVRNTYVVDFNSSLPAESYIRTDTEIGYYQWVPVILLFQCFLFYFPKIFWMACSGYSSLNIKRLLKMANEATYVIGDKRKETIEGIVEYLEKYIKIRNTVNTRYRTFEYAKDTLVSWGFHKGNYLVLIFTLTSLLYTISSLSQIFIIDLLLGIRFKTLGSDILIRAVKGDSLLDQNRFPIVTFCDFEIRQLANLQTWTVQCSLPTNFFNEKIFIMNWFLLVVMTTVNAIYFLYNLIASILPYRAEKYVQKFLEMDGILGGGNQMVPEHQKELHKEFVHKYLRRDGVFLIWLMSNKLNQVIASEIVNELWKKYSKENPYRSFNGEPKKA